MVSRQDSNPGGLASELRVIHTGPPCDTAQCCLEKPGFWPRSCQKTSSHVLENHAGRPALRVSPYSGKQADSACGAAGTAVGLTL